MLEENLDILLKNNISITLVREEMPHGQGGEMFKVTLNGQSYPVYVERTIPEVVRDTIEATIGSNAVQRQEHIAKIKSFKHAVILAIDAGYNTYESIMQYVDKHYKKPKEVTVKRIMRDLISNGAYYTNQTNKSNKIYKYS